MKRVFIIGKMTGMPRLGQHSFEFIENKLRNHGIYSISPLRLLQDIDKPFDALELKRESVREMIHCDTVVHIGDDYTGCPIAEGLNVIAPLICERYLSVNEILDASGNWIYKAPQVLTDLQGAEG